MTLSEGLRGIFSTHQFDWGTGGTRCLGGELTAEYLREHLVDHADELGRPKVERRPPQICYWDGPDLNRGSTRLVTDWKKA